MTALLAFVLPFALYIAFPSRMWNFDGVACAMALELGNPVFYFHANHLLYAWLGLGFWHLVALFGIHRALPALQLFTSLLSALGFTVLYSLLREAFQDRWLPLGIVWVMATAAVPWVWSVEAQVYTLGFLGLSVATYLLFRPSLPHRWLWVGLAQGLAVLGHIAHVMWIFPAMYWLWTRSANTGQRKRDLSEYGVSLTLCTVVPYLLVTLLVIVPRHPNRQWVERWLMGSAGLTNKFQWHFPGWTGPLQWLHTTLVFFWGSFWPYQSITPRWGWIVTGLSAALFVVVFGSSWRKPLDRKWIFSAVWLAAYALLFMTWEPSTECYRITDAIPLALIMGLGLQTLQPKALRFGLLTALFAMMLGVNFQTRISPMTLLSNNALNQQVALLARSTPENSIFLTAGGLCWIYLLYFQSCSAWDVHSFDRGGSRLASEVLRHSKFSTIYIQDQAFNLPSVQSWVHTFKIIPLGNNLPWYQLQ